MRWAGHVARMRDRRGAWGGLVGRPEGKRPIGRRRRRWEDNIKMGLQDVGWGHGLIWLMIWTGGGLLWMRQWTFGFYKMRGIAWPVSFSGRTVPRGVSVVTAPTPKHEAVTNFCFLSFSHFLLSVPNVLIWISSSTCLQFVFFFRGRHTKFITQMKNLLVASDVL